MLASLALLATLAAGSAGAAARPLPTGISFVEGADAATMRHVRDTGSSFVQIPLHWAWVAPATEPASWEPEDPADPSYDWGYYDAWVRSAAAAGLTPVLQVRDAPRWADRCEPTSGYESVCDLDPAALVAFTRAAVRRYGGGFEGLPRVRFWQGLNEPNLTLFFEPQYRQGKLVSPDLYRTLLNRFYAAVKSVRPGDRVLAAGLGPIAVPGLTVGPMTFARRLLCMRGGRHPRPTAGNCGGGVHFDIFDIHPYTTGSPSHRGGPNDVEMGDLPKLRRLLSAADAAGRIKNGSKRPTQLWITEFAYDSKPPDPGGLAMRIESQWTPEALHAAWRAGVSKFFWYSLNDAKPNPEASFSETLQSGLYFWNADPAKQRAKPVMYAFRFPFMAIRRAAGLAYWGRTPSSRGGRVVLEAKQGRGWRRLAVARANGAGIFQGFVATGYGRGKRGAVRARYRGSASPGFPMRRVGDFHQPPFG